MASYWKARAESRLIATEIPWIRTCPEEHGLFQKRQWPVTSFALQTKFQTSHYSPAGMSRGVRHIMASCIILSWYQVLVLGVQPQVCSECWGIVGVLLQMTWVAPPHGATVHPTSSKHFVLSTSRMTDLFIHLSSDLWSNPTQSNHV